MAIVLPLDTFLPTLDNIYVASSLVASSFLGTYAVLGKLPTYWPLGAEDRLKKLAFFSIMLLVCFLAIDLVDSVFMNVKAGAASADLTELRARDRFTWNAEVMPQPYHPTEDNFSVYKPESVSAGYAYGEDYYPGLLQHQIMKDEVLELRHLEFRIDQYGLRNTRKPEDARIFAIGDSFCFGYHMTQDATWTSLLESRLGELVYNMGISGSSPFQQQQQLEYFLREYPKAFRPQKLLWMIYEGNDLEDHYQPKRPRRAFLRRAFQGTLVETMASVPGQIRQQSVIRSLAEGRLILGSHPEEGQRSDHYILDGSRISVPLYYSPRFGHILLRPSSLLRAGKPLSYVLDHPNRRLLEDTFHRMREISQEHKFEITVVIVPSVVRLYKDYIDDLPPVTDEPHFINYLKKLSAEEGFNALDMNVLLAPYASSELLYQRDDTHWNERGHEIVSRLLEENVPLRDD